MAATATLTSAGLTPIYETLPSYETYAMHYNAETAESRFRQALASVMRDLCDRMLCFAETEGPILAPQKTEIIDLLVDEIGESLKVMNRRGQIRIPADTDDIECLESIDRQLIMVLEHMSASIESLLCDDPALFPITASDLTIYINSYSELIEERNRILGMGWESEIRMGLYCDPGRDPR